jgi:hypothetical protein
MKASPIAQTGVNICHEFVYAMAHCTCQPDESANDLQERAEFGLPVDFRIAKTIGESAKRQFKTAQGLLGWRVICVPITDELRLYGEVRRVVSAWHMLTNKE